MQARHGAVLCPDFPQQKLISELVSNAYDAESSKVAVTVPTGKISSASEIVVQDWGHGLTAQEVQDEYLPIGRNRRGYNSKLIKSKNNKRRVLGRKGLGKLAAFGIAKQLEVRTVKDGSAVCLHLDYDSMLDWAQTHRPDDPYQPHVVSERTGQTDDPDGVEIRLRDLKRKTPVDSDELRRGLARRLYVIGRGFQVKVNGIPITPKDRVRRSECADDFSWDVSQLPRAGIVTEDCCVTGWLGFTESSSQIGRGVNIVAHGKAVELGGFFNFPSTHAQWARAYFVGEIHADFLDDTEDLISTARNSVDWESEIGQAFEEWGRNALRWSFDRWIELRKKDKTERVVKAAGFDKWLAQRPKREQKIANRMVRLLIDDPKIDTHSAVPLLQIVKDSVESVFFHELVETIGEQGSDMATLLNLFGEWRIIEARTILKLADGRVEAMDKLRAYIDEGGLEVQQLQPLLEQNLWLLNPKWNEADGQTTYTDWLRKHSREPKNYADEERRLDILGVSSGGGVTVVEIKRPEKTLSRKDLQQVAQYVDWARNQFEGNGPHAPKYINGLLVVGQLSSRGDVQRELKRLATDDIRVETFRDLHTAAREYYGQAERVLKHIAPEYTRSQRKRAVTDSKKAANSKGTTGTKRKAGKSKKRTVKATHTATGR